MDPWLDPMLRKLCDEITIQEEKKGFFNSIVENIKENTNIFEWAQEQLSNKVYGYEFIEKLVNDSELFSAISDNFIVSEVYRKKCNKTAEKMISQADNSLSDGDFEKCKQFCSTALLRVDKNACNGLFILQKTLLLRARCLMKMENIDLAKKDIDAAIRSGPIEQSLKSFFKEILQSIKQSKSMLHEIQNREPSLGTSSYIELTESEDMGRFYVASEHIPLGENLIIEKPYSCYLTQSSFGTHCHHCFTRLEAPIGCLECSSVAFCGYKCMEEAVTTYHKYECKYMDLFIGSGMAILCFVALRIVTQVGLEECLRVYNKYVSGVAANEEVASDATHDHASFFKLCTHEEFRCPQDYVRRTLITFFMLQCLKHSSFFNENNNQQNSSNLLTPQEMTVWSLLLRSLQLLQFNAHQIMDSNSKEIGFGLYPKTSMMNHQCSPNVSRIFYGKHIIIQAHQPIEKGIMIGDSYGPQWGRSLKGKFGQNRDERRRILNSRYWFFCKCATCTQNWSTPPPEIPLIKCSDNVCSGIVKDNFKCCVCNKPVTKEYLNTIQNQLTDCIKNIKESLDIKDVELKKSSLKLHLEKYWELTRMPCPAVIKSEDMLRSLRVKSLTINDLVLKRI